MDRNQLFGHRTVNQSQNLSCPANQRGTWTQVRNYTEYYNGSIINDSGWQTSSNTCAYYYVSTGYDSSSSSCPTGYTGSITSTRSYENWSDGSKRNYSGWYQSGYSCVAIPPSQVNFQILQSPSGTSYCSHKWRIRVTYPNGTLASGITLNWTANSPGTSLNSYSTVTNSNGEVENFVGSYNNGYITATVKWGASSQNLSGVCVGGT